MSSTPLYLRDLEVGILLEALDEHTLWLYSTSMEHNALKAVEVKELILADPNRVDWKHWEKELMLDALARDPYYPYLKDSYRQEFGPEYIHEQVTELSSKIAESLG